MPATVGGLGELLELGSMARQVTRMAAHKDKVRETRTLAPEIDSRLRSVMPAA